MSHSQSSTPHASQTVIRPPARVPRRFAAGTLMILIAVYGLIIRGLMAVGMPMGGVVTIAGALTAAGAAQVFLFRGERPRYASIILGAVAAPTCAVVYAMIDAQFAEVFFLYQTIPQMGVAVYYLVFVGAILGYVSGCIAAGLFLLLGRFPWLSAGLDQPPNNSTTDVSEPSSHRGKWEKLVSCLSFYQIDRPIREFLVVAGVLLAVFLPLAIYMPWWRARIYLPTVAAIAIGLPAIRTGLRQLGWRLAVVFSVLSLLCSVGPSFMMARLNWADGFVVEFPIVGTVVVSFLCGLALSAGVGWYRWFRRSFLNREDSIAEVVLLTVLILTINVGASVYVSTRVHQPSQKALHRIHQLQGSVAYSFPNGNIFSGQVRHIDLHWGSVADEDLELIATLNTAEYVDLSNSRITDEGMQHLRDFPNLSLLNLGADRVTDAGVEHLSALTRLTMLSLQDTQITNRGVRSLKPLNLINLTLSGPQLDASVIDELADIGTLSSLSLRDIDLHAADLSKLARIPSLERLSLVRCNLHDDDLRGLAALPKLYELQVSQNPITDNCIDILPQLKSLGEVDLYKTEVTEEGIEALEAKNPACVFLGG